MNGMNVDKNLVSSVFLCVHLRLKEILKK